MPNFQTHWVVAWEALKGLGGPAAQGQKAYEELGRGFADKLRLAVEDVKTGQQVTDLPSRFEKHRQKWTDDLSSAANHHPTSCFSAFMLGAVGPDFWMVPASVTGGGLWDAATARAPDYFNLGHYNRTHRQFQRSIAAVGGPAPADRAEREQRELEQAYFCGMATHLAADLFIHQFVNLTAGAYNCLQEGVWKNEHGKAKLLPIHPWNLHNKVEQYLDSYMRYRFLGDVGDVFGRGELGWFTGTGVGGFEPIGLPTIERLRALAEGLPVAPEVRASLREVLADEDTRLLVERPLILPALFCDRVLGAKKGTGPQPFVYERVVSKQHGAYPPEEVNEDLLGDATGFQMGKWSGGYSERKKLRFFSSRQNDAVPVGVWSYLAYRVAPDLERLRGASADGLMNGLDRFYDLSAMKHFGAKAVELARTFVRELQGAYASGNAGDLRTLGRFWNLDTGLGLEVQGIAADTPHEVITRLDVLHVLDERIQPDATLKYARPTDAAKVRHLRGKAANADPHSRVEQRAFPVVSPPPERFPALRDVVEHDAKTFLDRLRVGPGVSAAPRLLRQSVDEFFSGGVETRTRAVEVQTASFVQQTQLCVQPMAHRLTLELRVAVPELGPDPEDPGMFFYCDQAPGIGDAATQDAHAWLNGSTFHRVKGKLVDHAAAREGVQPLRRYTARILVNLEARADPANPDAVDPKLAKRDLKQGSWNNVVPWEENRRFYGRNFAIGTGRRFVMRAKGKAGALFEDGTDGGSDSNLAYFAEPFPTEHVFLTLYPLVRARDGKVYDAFSKEEVTSKRFHDEIKKVWGVGWVKVVLLYVLGSDGCAQLDQCFVDGLPTPVRVAS